MNDHLDKQSQRRKARFRRPWLWKPRYMTELMREELCMAGTPIYPVSNNGTGYSGTGIDMSRYSRAMYHVGCSTVNTGGYCLFQLQQSNNSNMQTNSNIAASNSGTGTSYNISGSSQSATLEVRSDQMTARYLGLVAIIATNACTSFAFPWAEEARQHPAGGTNQDDSSMVNRSYA